MRSSTTVLLSSVLLAALTTSASAELRIDVDKASQRMTVTVDGQPRYTWPVSTGVSGYDTPSGSFKPFRMEASHFSREFDNAPMPHAVFFTQIGHAIHGTNQVRSLGRAASHGCVRLSPGNAATLYSLIKAQGMANTRITLQGEVEDRVAGGGRGRGYRTAPPRRGYDDGDVMPAGLQAARPPPGYRYAPRQRTYDPFGDGYYGQSSGYGEY
ncbi:L,D-transpeptidase [Methylobacterium haplocladii]|uniref:L,D-TPase catalytic domain-containing protein n=1 Tax=Methylobacterium haplocladii TaxID=1176176 RepID=A0A512ITF1_9HYPH|nr:L,D-transpeptidase [Methylobacterium haplocladii]GEP00970.1 hypothetical protein MHA02_33570 [Methylobacterium haplocladii]GJD84925.1 hypothetical protein HPGCJGGD_2808 [Methylobacterium haplocladii]GLS58316.1 hypothetical protein GCM10007887_09750 [Methylobacterium haplocladii]